jgi:hypothetical protein
MPDGFGLPSFLRKEHRFWLLAYSQDDEDTPARAERITIATRPGGDPMPQLLRAAHDLLLANPDHHELLAHRGANPEPASGAQVVARLSREPFNESLPYPC